jgi:threonine/homoserine/homoserine lactone efflux protein
VPTPFAQSFKTCALGPNSVSPVPVTLEQSIAFFIFAVVAAITPGPSNIMLTATGAIVGVMRGIPCLLGVAVGMGLLIFGVAVGLGQLVLGHAAVLRALNWLGAAFLLWQSWKIATSGQGTESAERKPVGFAGAALFQWVNPKSWLVGASAAGAYLQATADGVLLQAIAFASLFVAAALPSGLVWLAFGASVHRFLRSTRAARIFNVVMGASLAASVGLILW